MTDSTRKILLFSEDEQLAQLAGKIAEGARVIPCTDKSRAAELLSREENFQVLLVDSHPQGGELLRENGGKFPFTVRLALEPEFNQEESLDKLRSGLVFRVLKKPVEEADLAQSLLQAFHLSELLRELHGAKGAPSADGGAAGEAPLPLEGSAVKGSAVKDSAVEGSAVMESLDHFRNDMLMTATHDIRSPLSVILGYANIMQESGESLSDRGKVIMERIQRTSGRLLTLVDHILDLAIMESGKMKLECQQSHLAEIVASAVENLAGNSEERNIVVKVDINGGGNTYNLDFNKVIQILQNVLSNAIKFSREGGEVSIVCTATPNRITFQVRDSGPGLTADQKSKVFEKFARFSDIAQQGSGLGLAIAKSLVEMHGGTIWAEDNDNNGSTFIFTLTPCSQATG